MLSTLLLLVPLLAPTRPMPAADVRARYVELAEASDAAGCRALWKEARGAILPTIDADLEGSLKVREDAGGRALTAEETTRIQEMHQRALWGARQAAETGHPFILDYAASFVGWNEEQRSSFRAGQRAYGEARAALKKGEIDAARDAAKRCRELAAPLGDWWGAQMGWEAEARALDLAGQDEEALAAWSRVRMVAATIALTGDEYEAVRRVAEISAKLGRVERARAAARAALDLAEALGDTQGRAGLEKLARDGVGAK
jgi:tetratricopeptide (TPR) repeat protein